MTNFVHWYCIKAHYQPLINFVKIHEPVSYEQLRKHFHMDWMESLQWLQRYSRQWGTPCDPGQLPSPGQVAGCTHGSQFLIWCIYELRLVFGGAKNLNSHSSIKICEGWRDWFLLRFKAAQNLFFLSFKCLAMIFLVISLS